MKIGSRAKCLVWLGSEWKVVTVSKFEVMIKVKSSTGREFFRRGKWI